MKRLSSPLPAQAGFAVLPVQRQFRRRGAPPWTLHREHRLDRVAHLPQPAAVPAKVYPPEKIRATRSIFLQDEPLSRLNYWKPMFRLKVYFVFNLSFHSICTHSSSRRKHDDFAIYGHNIPWNKESSLLKDCCCKDDHQGSIFAVLDRRTLERFCYFVKSQIQIPMTNNWDKTRIPRRVFTLKNRDTVNSKRVLAILTGCTKFKYQPWVAVAFSWCSSGIQR